MLFKPFKNKFINVLVIGIWYGESLKKLQEYFPFANIYGLDDFSIIKTPSGIKTFEAVKRECQPNKRIHIIKGSSKTFSWGSKKHSIIIIDDADHTIDGQLAIFQNNISYLTHDGLYIIEDTNPELLLALQKLIGESYPGLEATSLKWYKDSWHDDAIILVRKTPY